MKKINAVGVEKENIYECLYLCYPSLYMVNPWAFIYPRIKLTCME